MRVTRTAALAIAGLMAVAGVAACSSGTAKKSGGSGATVLHVGMPNGAQTNNSNPFLGSSAGASLGYRFMIYEPLAMMNAVKPADPGKPWLATKWDWTPDYKSVTLTIRDGVTWSDGQKMTADDVTYTFQLLQKYAALNLAALPITDAKTNGNQVTVTFSASQFVNQTKVLTTFVVPQHIWSKMADPTKDANQQPVGTGPYTLKSFTPQTVVLTERSGYWQDAPKVKEIDYTSYSGNDTQTTALTSGACEWSFVFIPNAKTVYQAKDPAHFQLWFPPTLGIHGLWFNVTKAPWDNASLRRAVSMVINREDIFNQGESGYFYPQVTNVTGIPTPAGDPFISADYKGKDQAVDVDGAKALLATAGFTLAGNTLKDPSGKPVTIVLSDPAGWSDYQTDLEIIKDNLSKIGIAASIDKADQNAWFGNVDTGNFGGVLHWTNGGATPYDIYQNIMDGALYKPVGTAGVGGNYGRFQSPEATTALQQYATATDDATRTAAMNTLEKIMVEQMPMVPLMAANVGGEFSTKNWTGWPSDANPYAGGQPTIPGALDVVLHLNPA